MEKQMTATPYYDETESYDDGAVEPMNPNAGDPEPDMSVEEIEPSDRQIERYRHAHGGSVGDAYRAVRRLNLLAAVRAAREDDDIDALYCVVEAIVEGM